MNEQQVTKNKNNLLILIFLTAFFLNVHFKSKNLAFLIIMLWRTPSLSVTTGESLSNKKFFLTDVGWVPEKKPFNPRIILSFIGILLGIS